MGKPASEKSDLSKPKRMDRNTIIGFVLIFGLLMAWQQFTQPSAEERAEMQRVQDSIRVADSLAQLATTDLEQQVPTNTNTAGTSTTAPSNQAGQNDSLQQLQNVAKFGAFAPAAAGEEQFYTLENNVLKLTISSKGGRIVEANLKEFLKIAEGEQNVEIESPLLLLEDTKNRFEYFLPVPSSINGQVSSMDLNFTGQVNGRELVLRAPTNTGGYFEQKYTLDADAYHLNYDVAFEGLNGVLSGSADEVELRWINYLDRLEKNTEYERNYSTVYFKPTDESSDHCSCTSDDTEEAEGQALKWVSNSNQFFNSTLIAGSSFKGGVFETELTGEESADLKKLISSVKIPLDEPTFAMEWYIGPNEFERLKSYDMGLQDVVPFGSSILGTINRWVIRPIFAFIASFISNKGIVILILTLIVKLLLYPLTYRMLKSQSKMAALKPELAKLGDKFADDPQKKQVETMKIYQEFGVNPLGGCLPIAAQMPIWIALYRFFPGSIEFRQESFLWATDLSSYDVAFSLPMEIPFYGDHVSLFTLLWAGTTVLYTYYNTRHMDMSANPAMKYMQYFMPIMFLFFFNNFAAGLTCYLLFSNILNITQTLVTKNVIIDQDKLKAELDAYRSKPSSQKKAGFGSRLQEALKESQRIQEERERQKKNKRKK